MPGRGKIRKGGFLEMGSGVFVFDESVVADVEPTLECFASVETAERIEKTARKAKPPQVFRFAGVSNFGGEGGIRTHGTGKPYA
jgi:hypothetical protein